MQLFSMNIVGFAVPRGGILERYISNVNVSSLQPETKSRVIIKARFGNSRSFINSYLHSRRLLNPSHNLKFTLSSALPSIDSHSNPPYKPPPLHLLVLLCKDVLMLKLTSKGQSQSRSLSKRHRCRSSLITFEISLTCLPPP